VIKACIQDLSLGSWLSIRTNIDRPTLKARKAKWIGRILCMNCLPKHVIKSRIEGTGRRGRRRKQVLDDLKEKRGYCKVKEEALDRTLWRTRFERGYGPVIR
jgi:hypothetical protein